MKSPPDNMLVRAGLQDRFAVVRAYSGGEGFSAAVRERDDAPLRFLKILDREADPVEGSLLASLRHPRIPAVLETGRTADGSAFLVREHVDGESLDQLLPLPPAAVLDLATQLLEVLAYVHLRGILHLDLKPANVLRCGEASEPRYVLVDFGLGRRGEGPASGGTQFFAAPERLMGVPPDPRSDLFSLGALLWVALKGRRAIPHRAFQSRFPHESFFAATGSRADDLPAPFDRVLPRLLARRRGHRFGDAQEALESLVGGSGRPSVELLRPDAIWLFGERLEECVAALRPGEDLVLEGGDPDDRHALAVHVACLLDDVRVVTEGDRRTVIERGGVELRAFSMPPVTTADCARHLECAVGLGERSASAAARAICARGADRPELVARTLQGLVDKGRVRPDGPRWVWPDAEAGRFDLEAP